MIINFKKLEAAATIPTRGSSQAAGYDLYAINDESFTIRPHSTEMIHTGLSVAIPEGYYGAIFARSGLATKQSLRPANCCGIIDSDYRGELLVALHNDSDIYQMVPAHSRIAQLVICPYLSFDIKVVNELDDTERGEGGFGSTGLE